MLGKPRAYTRSGSESGDNVYIIMVSGQPGLEIE